MGCNREPVSWQTQQQIPLAKLSFTLSDLFPENVDTVGSGILNFSYSDTLLRFGLDSLLNLPDTTVFTPFSLPIIGSISVPENVNVISLPDEFQIVANGAQLTRAAIDSGWVDLVVSNPFNGTFVVAYTLPQVTQNGELVSVAVTVPPGTPNNPSVTTTTIGLHGASADLTGPAGDSFNTLSYLLTIRTAASAGAATLTGGDSLLINSTYRDIRPAYAEGYFGQLQNSYIDTVSTDLTELFTADFLILDSGSATLTIINEFGVDFRTTVNSLEAINSSESLNLSYPQLGIPVNISRAIQGEQVIPSSQAIALGSQNSNVMSLVSLLPEQIAIDANIQLNPLGNISNNFDFAYGDGAISLLFDAVVPLQFRASNLQFSDTLEWTSTSTSQEFPEIDQLIFFLRCQNHFTLTFGGKLKVIGINNVVLDELIVSPQISAGQSPGVPTETWLTLPSSLTSSSFSDIKFIVFELQISTPVGGSATITTQSKIDIDISTNAHVQLQAN